MGTQAIVSVMRGGKVVVKAVCGCNGFTAPHLAAAVRAGGLDTKEAVLDACRDADFGCEDCTVVQDAAGHVPASVELVGPLYAAKFAEPRFNPRWDYGTAAYVEVIHLDGGPCDHEWGIDGAHSNEYCKRCFASKPED